MPRLARVDVGGELYHVINRANGRLQIFNNAQDYIQFEKHLFDAKELVGTRILAYVIMPNHWHLLLQPCNDGDLGLFMHRVTNTHTREVHVRTKTIGSGHLYQGQYESFLVDTDTYFLTLLKYIERNPVRARLVSQCEDWQWGSAWRRIQGTSEQKKLLDPPTTPLPHQYKRWINTPDKDEEKKLLEIRRSVNKGMPYGGERWVDSMITKYNLITTTRAPGRPKK